MKAIILAGGAVKGNFSKPMAYIAGKPFLEHQIRFLKDYGVDEIIIAVHQNANMIKSHFGTGHRWGVNLTYTEEEVPLGTGGAIKKAEKYIDNTFLVMNSDSYLDIDLKKLLEFHNSKRSLASMVVTKPSEPGVYSKVVKRDEKIIEFSDYGNGDLINAGLYIFEPKIFNLLESERSISMEKEIFPELVRNGYLLGYEHVGYFLNLDKPETFNKFKQEVLNSISMKKENRVREAMNKISKTGVDLILIVNEDRKLLGVLNDKLIKRYILAGGNLDENLESAMIKDFKAMNSSDSKEKVDGVMMTGYRHLPIVDDYGILKDVEFRVEEIKEEVFPTVRGRVPLRISFAGGGTDLPYFFEKHGGVVINSTIDKYCYASITKRADSKIHICSESFDELILNSLKNIEYDGKYDLIKSVLNVMNPKFGMDIYLHNDIPGGRGLGSSASLAVLLVKIISHLDNSEFDDYKIAEMAFKAEREELKIAGGWQDQYAAVSGGFNYMEFDKAKNIIYPLKLKDRVVSELNSRLMLCFVGQSHSSRDQHTQQREDYHKSEEENIKIHNEHKSIAVAIKDALLTNEIEEVGKLLHESWMSKRKLSGAISNPNIDRLYNVALKNGAYGGRLLGSGGGGYILLAYSPMKRHQLTKALKEDGGEILNFNFEFEGTKIWQSK